MTDPNPTLRRRWRDGATTLGAWLSLPSTVSAEIVARADLDYVCIDTQHGAVDYSSAVPMIQAITLGGASPIVRVPWNEPGVIGKMLDAGAQGIVVPMVNRAEEAEAAVRACRYPPDGARSFGPTLAALRAPAPGGYVDWARENVAAVPMIETREALDRIDDILAVDGIDAVYVGPADLSLSLGLRPGNNDDEPVFAEALRTVVAACERAGVVAGIHSTGALTPVRAAAGFRMITVTADAVALRLGLTAELERARSGGPVADEGSLY